MKTVMIVLSVVSGIAALGGCGLAQSSPSVRVDIVTAPDGTRCYALVQDDQVRGGSCAH